jgi:hypothetical protein
MIHIYFCMHFTWKAPSPHQLHWSRSLAHAHAQFRLRTWCFQPCLETSETSETSETLQGLSWYSRACTTTFISCKTHVCFLSYSKTRCLGKAKNQVIAIAFTTTYAHICICCIIPACARKSSLAPIFQRDPRHCITFDVYFQFIVWCVQKM